AQTRFYEWRRDHFTRHCIAWNGRVGSRRIGGRRNRTSAPNTIASLLRAGASLRKTVQNGKPWPQRLQEFWALCPKAEPKERSRLCFSGTAFSVTSRARAILRR